MPSTHSTALTFYFAYLVPILLFSSPSTPGGLTGANGAGGILEKMGMAARYTAAVAITAYWAGGIWSRVELGYHTYPQCFGGIALGTVLAVVWRGVWEKNSWMESIGQRLIDTVWRTTMGRLGW